MRRGRNKGVYDFGGVATENDASRNSIFPNEKFVSMVSLESCSLEPTLNGYNQEA